MIGANLGDIVASQPGKKNPAYVILFSNDFSGDLFHYGVKFLRSSLRAGHHYDEKTHEVNFPAIRWMNARREVIELPDIVLNVQDIVKSREDLYLSVGKTRQLISNGILQTSFCFWKSPEIQTLKSCDIIVIEGAIDSEDSLSPVCTLNLQGITQKWQVTIYDITRPNIPTRRNFRAMYEGGEYKPHALIGWEYY